MDLDFRLCSVVTLLLLIQSFLVSQTLSKRGEVKEIKINEPRQSYSSYNSNNNNQNSGGSSDAGSSYRQPHDKSTNADNIESAELKHLVEFLTDAEKFDFNSCIEGTQGTYTYKVCLFDKVTQSENWYVWTLGVFDKWKVCPNNGGLCLHYNDGQHCGDGNPRETTVQLTCESANGNNNDHNRLYEVTEPETCRYHMLLYIPAICNGAGGYLNSKGSKGLRKDMGDLLSILGDLDALDAPGLDATNQRQHNRMQYLYQLCTLSQSQAFQRGVMRQKWDELMIRLQNETKLFEFEADSNSSHTATQVEAATSNKASNAIVASIDVCEVYFSHLSETLTGQDSIWLKTENTDDTDKTGQTDETQETVGTNSDSEDKQQTPVNTKKANERAPMPEDEANAAAAGDLSDNGNEGVSEEINDDAGSEAVLDAVEDVVDVLDAAGEAAAGEQTGQQSASAASAASAATGAGSRLKQTVEKLDSDDSDSNGISV